MIKYIARLALAGALIWLPLADASAAVVQITVKDAGGTSRNVSVTTNTDATGNLLWNNVICDQAAGATCASVGAAGSPSTNALTIQAVTLGHGVAANAMRVELPTDGTGQVNAILGAETTKVIGTVRVASGGVASGSYASGSFASGAYASGSIGSGAIAAGAVAAGAYVSGSILSGALASGAGSDGWDVTQGSKADAATCATTNTALACLRQIDADIKSSIPLGTAGGWTPLKLAALTNTAVAIKASAGWLGKLYCYNPNATVAYVQVYNVASGSVTVGTTASIPYGIPATNASGFVMDAVGDQYGTAMAIAATTTATGGTAPGTALDCNVSFN